MMKFKIQPQKLLPYPAHKLMRWSGGVFLILGIVALSYVSYVWFDTQYYQAKQSQRLADALQATPPSQPLFVSEGAPLGRIEINRVGLTAIVQEGIDADTLRRAVGHIPGTSLPGQRGNVALAGHRDTFFRELRNLRLNDEIILTTLNNTLHYRVEMLTVVEPEATEVLIDAGYDKLTLVTCYPFNFVGSAPQRFIVSARKITQ